MENVVNITGCLLGCDCERCSGWMLAPGQEDTRQLLRDGVTLIEFDLDELAAIGCKVALYRDTHYLGPRAYIELPDGRSMTCGTGHGAIALERGDEALDNLIVSLIERGASFEELSFG